MLIFPELPEGLLTIARRAPLASVMTLAVPPRFCALIAVAKPFSVWSVLLIVTVAGAALPTAIWNEPVAKVVVAAATGLVYSEAVVAREFTTMACVPVRAVESALAL